MIFLKDEKGDGYDPMLDYIQRELRDKSA